MKRRKRRISVLDFSHLLPGEYCSTLLADVGFDVIRIEPVTPGLNKVIPPVVKGESLYYWSIHRNKTCLSVDLKHPDGLKLVRKMSKGVDVILENFTPGTMDRLGLGYEKLSDKNPGLVYCSISGYGQGSNRQNEPAHDLNLQAEAGLLSAGQGDKIPSIPGVLIADYATALTASTAIMGALFQRDLNGAGRHLDISMLQCAAQLLGYQATSQMYTGVSPEEGGFDFPRLLPNYAVYRCKDGEHLAVACIEPQYWRNFCLAIGLTEEKTKPPRFDADGKAVFEKVQKLLETKNRDEWLKLFAGKKCCVSPVNSVTEALSDEDIARSAIVSMSHTKLGTVKQMQAFLLKKDGGGKGHLDNDGDPAHVLKRFKIPKRVLGRLIESGALSRTM